MTRTTVLFVCLFLLGCPVFSQHQDPNLGSINDSVLHFADPTIFPHEGVYYLYGTVAPDADQGFLVYTSTDLKSWMGPYGKKGGYVLRKPSAFGTKGFWAPQVFYEDGSFYMAYTANEQIAFARSSSPLGPFVQDSVKAFDTAVKKIDPFMFQDDDGKKYLYHVRLSEGNRIFVAGLKDDLSGFIPGTLTECIAAEDAWENTEDASWPVAEGPTVLKYKGYYYLIYSANDFRNPDYAVGYAVSKHPYGPWKKHAGNPVIHGRMVNESGTGHGDIFRDQQGDWYYVFHTHFSDSLVSPRKTAVIKAGFEGDGKRGPPTLTFDRNSFYFLKQR